MPLAGHEWGVDLSCHQKSVAERLSGKAPSPCPCLKRTSWPQTQMLGVGNSLQGSCHEVAAAGVNKGTAILRSLAGSLDQLGSAS